MAFYVRRLASHAKEWWSDLVDATRGVAPGCRILPVRVLGALQREGKLIGAGLVDNIDSGIKWAVDNGASVINMSLGVRGTREWSASRPGHRVRTTTRCGGRRSRRERRHQRVVLPGIAPRRTRHRRRGSRRVRRQFLDVGPAGGPGRSRCRDLQQPAPRELRLRFWYITSVPVRGGCRPPLLRSAANDRGHHLTAGQVRHLLVHTAERPGRNFKDLHLGHGLINLVGRAPAPRAPARRNPHPPTRTRLPNAAIAA